MTRAARKLHTRRPARRQQARRRRRLPAVDVMVASVLWKSQRNAKALVQRAIATAASAVSTAGCEVAIVLTDDSAIRTLNRNWRQKNAATNVLSFPAHENLPPPLPRAEKQRAKIGRVPRLLGDIVIAYETTEREARAERKPFAHHLTHLAVHGFLHLVGYDHLADEEAEAMEGLETAILARLGVPDPYIAR
jgi:probable rRNA maturation factor